MDSSILGRIDQYELLRELGSGGFGCVYLAHDTIADINVAVKGLPPIVRNQRAEIENIKRNFALVSRLHHPNIAAALTLHPAFDVTYANSQVSDKLHVFKGDTLVVMQYAPGITLSKWVKQFPGGIVPIEKAIEITSYIAKALDYAHAEKILHRDIKPENVMIDADKDSRSVIRVLDFGLAAEIHSSISRVSNDISDTSGTRPYMAPEQWLGSDQGHETDQYSLAVLFYELVTGKVPFSSAFQTGDPMVMFGAISRKDPEIPDWLPKSIRSALHKALSKKRTDRFSSCSEFSDALRNGVKSKASFFTLLAGGAVCLLLVVGALAFRFAGGGSNNDESVAQRNKTVEQNTPSDINAVPIKDSDVVETYNRPSRAVAASNGEVIAQRNVVVRSTDDEKAAVSYLHNDSSDVPLEKLPPKLKIIAVFEGKELSGAKIRTMNGVFELPYEWEGDISNRHHLGPYQVSYERGSTYLSGEFKVESIDWSGLKTVKVELKRSDKPKSGGIQAWAF